MATFNIYGCCICRDLFSNIPYNTHEVSHFLQAASPIAHFFFNTKPKKELTMDDFENINMPNFEKKCIINDYNKTLVDYYTKPSDFFIVDLVFTANTNLINETYPDGTDHYFTCSSWFNKAYGLGLKDFFKDSKIEKLNRLELLEEHGYDIVLDNLIKWIKSLGYKEEQIILIEDNRTPNYTHAGKLYYFPEETRDAVNGRIADLCKSFKEKSPGCHTIKMPWGAYGDSANKWSLRDQHYSYEFYEYLYKCVDAITEDSSSCDQIIAQLREEYAALFYHNLNDFAKNSIVGKQLLKGNLNLYEDEYIAMLNSEVYNNPLENKNGVAKLTHHTRVDALNFPYAKTAEGYVHVDDCVKGIIGNDKNLNSYWKTINASTCVIFNDHSITIRHVGNASKGQMNLIQTIENTNELVDTTVTLSVWARVLQRSNDNGRGGTIAFINSDSYNKGDFFQSKGFTNTKWQRISLTAKLPKKENFVGLTVCLRANAGTGDNPQHAIVEFANPKLEIGLIPT
ncbi:MAG: hypothetical protein K2G56_03680 [Eubacterium sp.]|nr:hypothetical protein [Eubacterium sp.]